MTPGIFLSPDLSTLFFINSSSQKTDISLANGKVAKVVLSGGNLTVTEESSMPGGGTSISFPVTSYNVALAYDPSTSKLHIIGVDDLQMGIAYRHNPIDLTGGTELYIGVDSGNFVAKVI